jgi:hypothetical protein
MGVPRDEQQFVAVVEELGTGTNGHCVFLKVVSIRGEVGNSEEPWHRAGD